MLLIQQESCIRETVVDPKIGDHAVNAVGILYP